MIPTSYIQKCKKEPLKYLIIFLHVTPNILCIFYYYIVFGLLLASCHNNFLTLTNLFFKTFWFKCITEKYQNHEL